MSYLHLNDYQNPFSSTHRQLSPSAQSRNLFSKTETSSHSFDSSYDDYVITKLPYQPPTKLNHLDHYDYVKTPKSLFDDHYLQNEYNY